MEYKLEQDPTGSPRYFIHLHTDVKIEPIAVIYRDYRLARKITDQLNQEVNNKE